MTKNKTLVLGICGPVGVGKTLLIQRIQEMLSERYSLATLSDGIFTVKDLNYVSPLNIGLADELDQLRLSGKINLALIERPSRYLIPVDAMLYLIDASANELQLTLMTPSRKSRDFSHGMDRPLLSPFMGLFVCFCIFLVIDIFLYNFFAHIAQCTHIVTWRPKMTAPILATSYFWMIL